MTTHAYEFNERYELSRGEQEQSDIELLQRWLDGCVSVVKATESQDRAGVDYVATLRNGAKVLIDGKTRETRPGGIARFWRNGPELALERWSKVPVAGRGGKVGWTLCEKKQVDYVLFTYAPADSNEAYLLPFQLLRMAYRRNLQEWHSRYRVQQQRSFNKQSGRIWHSECVFVPAAVVIDAINQVSRTTANNIGPSDTGVDSNGK